MKKIISLFLFALVCFYSNAQNIPSTQTSCATATQGVSGNFVISYTIGEMPLVQSWKANGLLITQGILQPITFTTDTVYECYSNTEVRVYPNPTNGVFSIQYAILKKGKAVTLLYNTAGQQLQKDAFDYNSFTRKTYDINHCASGRYYMVLIFTEEGGKTKKCAYTIQKIN